MKNKCQAILHRVSLYLLASLTTFCISCGSDDVTSKEEDKPETPEVPDQPEIEHNRPMKFADDDEFLDYVQKAHINYMWDGANKGSGMAAESQLWPHVVTLSGTGMGVAGLIVAAERGFFPRAEIVERLHKICDFLNRVPRFHGVWSHWNDGDKGVNIPFSPKDNGGDLPETAIMMEGLLCVRQYFKDGNKREKELAAKIDKMWREIDWNWYTNGTDDKLFWHWSPDYQWVMNMPMCGYTECHIAFILAASSPTQPIDPVVYHKGWCRSGAIKSNEKPFGIPLYVDYVAGDVKQFGGPL